jgi:hypothetical protein
MDFSHQNTRPQAHAMPGTHNTAMGTPGTINRKQRLDKGKWGRVGLMTMLGCVVILLVALIVFIASGGSKGEDRYVDASKLQAVFLNTGQVYFGNIKTLNGKYFVLTNIYYLQTTNSNGSSSSSSSSNNNVTLVKLGCELHQPYDQMVINTSQVTFWENLQSTGQVAKAVAKFQQQNPNGQKCSDQSSSSGSTTNATQPANGNSGSSNNSGSSTR